jgi:hypothetical protein
MRRSTLAALAAAAALSGCPLPQPLPDYPAGTITPPRILPEATTSSVDAIIPVPAGCATGPEIPLDARIFYQDSVSVEARWFVDYRTDSASRYAIQNPSREVPPDPDPLVLERQVPPFTFLPYGFPPPAELGVFPGPSAPGVVHVVELVVSNGFDPNPAAPEPNRTPAVTDGDARFEIQTYRWVFVNVAGLPCP